MNGQGASEQRSRWDPKRAVALAALQALLLVGIFFVGDVIAGTLRWNSTLPLFVIAFLIRYGWLRYSRKDDPTIDR